MRGKAAVLFDAAGTLIHLREPVGETYTRFARHHGAEVSRERIGDAFGAVFRHMPPMAFSGKLPEEIATLERNWWRKLVSDVFAEADARHRFSDFESFFAELFDHFARATTWSAATGAVEILTTLRELGFSTGVVSNFDRRLLAILDGLELASHLDVVVLPSDVGAAKPSPRIFHFALQRLGVAADHALYVGDDTAHDIEGAQRAGLKSIDVRTLHSMTEITTHLSCLLNSDS